MSDREHSPAVVESAEPKAADTVEIPAEASPAPNRVPAWRAAAAGLAAALLLVVALVATAPFWAKLLPWGPGRSDQAERALAARLDRLEAAQAEVPPQVRQQQEQLRKQVEQVQQATAEAKSSLQRLAQRFEALEARAQSPAEGDVAELRQQLAQASRNASELAARLDTVEKGTRERTARDTTDAAMIMGLLQMRGAVQTGRPFAAEYEAFAALARRHPEITEAVAPLAEPAQTGVASPAVLAKRLRELAGGIAGAGRPVPPPDPGSPGWAEATLTRLRGLVTIRRVEGAKPGAAETAVNAAELALAGGDLAAAVAALDKLTGASADAAAPWLRMARQRLAVDAALRRLETLVTARLGGPTTAPGSSG